MIDTHCHLDYLEDATAALERARGVGLKGFVLPAVGPENFERVRALAHSHPDVGYALGIHPCSVDRLGDGALAMLEDALTAHADDPRLVAVGEIGLDHFVPHLNKSLMEELFHQQLRLARAFELPVILHVRRAQDLVLRGLRRFGIRRGIAHAFNGSFDQARAFTSLGLRLGFGGAMTFSRAHQIHRLASGLPLEDLVLETDSPDITPSWMPKGSANQPSQIPGIADYLARLRSCKTDDIVRVTSSNACASLPKLAALLASH